MYRLMGCLQRGLASGLLALLLANMAWADEEWPSDQMLYDLRESLMKVNTTTRSGGHGFGTAVAISPEKAVTNCHVLTNANGVSITKWGSEYAVDAVQADWPHDLCILTIKYAQMKPVVLGDNRELRYEQPLISISMPSDSPAPYTAMTQVRALYPMPGELVIRTQTAFAIGASGSPLFDMQGRLVGISTFKSPGRTAYYYNMPVNWVKALLLQPEQPLQTQQGRPFWDAIETDQPFFMRVVLPYQHQQWAALAEVANAWHIAEPDNAEAWFYQGEAARAQGQQAEASQAYARALQYFPQHPATLKQLWLQALAAGDTGNAGRYANTLQQHYPSLFTEWQQAYAEQQKAVSTP